MARLNHICGWCRHYSICRILHKIGDDIHKLSIFRCDNFEDTRKQSGWN